MLRRSFLKLIAGAGAAAITLPHAEDVMPAPIPKIADDLSTAILVRLAPDEIRVIGSPYAGGSATPPTKLLFGSLLKPQRVLQAWALPREMWTIVDCADPDVVLLKFDHELSFSGTAHIDRVEWTRRGRVMCADDYGGGIDVVCAKFTIAKPAATVRVT